MRRPLAEAGAVALALGLMAVLMGIQAWKDSLTYDERTYVRSGTCDIILGVSDLEPTNPVIYQLLAGAGVILGGANAKQLCADWDRFFEAPAPELHRLIFSARAPILGISVLLALFVYLWGRALLGVTGGLIALTLTAFEPTVLAHGHLATADMSLTVGMVACLAAHWAWLRGGHPAWLVASGIGLGWAFMSKLVALELLPLLPLVVLVANGDGWRARVRRAAIGLLVPVGVGWAFLCLVYLPFHGFYHATPILPALVSWLLPPTWVAGLRFQLGHAAASQANYLNGSLSTHGVWFYFLEAMILKASPGFLLLTTIGVVLGCLRRNRAQIGYLAIPAAATFVGATVAGVDIGIRYVLPAFPLLALLGGSALPPTLETLALPRAGRRRQLRNAASRLGLGVAAGLAVLTVAVSVCAMPDHISYFNPLAGDHPESYLSDSNLDWGQDDWRLRKWWLANGSPHLASAVVGSIPLATYGINADAAPLDRPVDGMVVVSVAVLGLTKREPAILRGKRVVAQVGRTMVIYGRIR